MRKHDDEFKNTILDAVLIGNQSHRKIARMFGIAESTICVWLRELKDQGLIPDKPHDIRRIDPQLVADYLEEHPNAPTKEIAAALKCSISTVERKLWDLGLIRERRDGKLITIEMSIEK